MKPAAAGLAGVPIAAAAWVASTLHGRQLAHPLVDLVFLWVITPRLEELARRSCLTYLLALVPTTEPYIVLNIH